MSSTGLIAGGWQLWSTRSGPHPGGTVERLFGPQRFVPWQLLRGILGAGNVTIFYTALRFTTVPESMSIWYTVPIVSKRSVCYGCNNIVRWQLICARPSSTPKSKCAVLSIPARATRCRGATLRWRQPGGRAARRPAALPTLWADRHAARRPGCRVSGISRLWQLSGNRIYVSRCGRLRCGQVSRRPSAGQLWHLLPRLDDRSCGGNDSEPRLRSEAQFSALQWQCRFVPDRGKPIEPCMTVWMDSMIADISLLMGSWLGQCVVSYRSAAGRRYTCRTKVQAASIRISRVLSAISNELTCRNSSRIHSSPSDESRQDNFDALHRPTFRFDPVIHLY